MEDLDLSDHRVTSEVHVFSEGESLKDEENIGKFSWTYFDSLNRPKKYNVLNLFIVISSFNFSLPPKLALSANHNANQETTADDDGDLVVCRKDFTPDFTLSISKQCTKKYSE